MARAAGALSIHHLWTGVSDCDLTDTNPVRLT